MNKDWVLPAEYQAVFAKLQRYIPDPLRDEEVFLETAVSYLKLGGERLARCRIDAAGIGVKIETRKSIFSFPPALSQVGADDSQEEDAEEEDSGEDDD